MFIPVLVFNARAASNAHEFSFAAPFFAGHSQVLFFSSWQFHIQAVLSGYSPLTHRWVLPRADLSFGVTPSGHLIIQLIHRVPMEC